MAFAQSSRPIEGAVATLGVSDRITFLRRTYAHLGVALIAFAVITGGMMTFATQTSIKFTLWATNGYMWLAVLAMFMVVGYVAERLARSESSRGIQYVGLLIAVIGEAILIQPMIWLAVFKLGGRENTQAILEAAYTGKLMMSSLAAQVILESVVITVAIFVGLTLTVFVTKKDFSFMRGALMIGSFAALGVIVASILFGFHLGAIFSGVMILLMAGYILYQTSLVMNDFPPSGYVAASLMLFATVATLFWYVLRLMISLRSD
jgi:FtsH-binding integral membrane protein